MNLRDPKLNAKSVDKAMTEPTVDVGGVEYTVEKLVEVKALELRAVFDIIVKNSTHNADLLEALESGSDFRIAFRRNGAARAAVWTRVAFKNQDLLKAAAVEEVTNRQADTLKRLADLLGVDTFTLKNI